ncbi:MAG: HEAT repeat domain-containing protein, partial [Candidatus Hydrogenedentes bacterium]|nr:HEAT repeat domain-containing protein [Candidatus Hydrogenedentota bacterium]
LSVTTFVAADDIPDEATLVGVLNGNTGWQEKQAACRGLRIKGTPTSIPALAALLTDEKLSHMARYALEPMPYPEAGHALRDALAKTDGLLKAGVISSLGARRDTDATPLIAPLLKDSDTNVARAAAAALGRIASPKATDALLKFRGQAPETVRAALAEGLLAAARRLTQEGKNHRSAGVYQKLLATEWPMYVRMGAFHGLMYARPKQAPTNLIAALRGNEPLFRDVASQIIAETSGADTTTLYARSLPMLPTAGQVALIRGLAGRKDPLARPAIAQAALGTDREVKLAAVKALGVLGDADDVPALTGLLSSDDADLTRAANASLGAMEGENVNPAIADAFPDATAAVRRQLLDLLVDRRATQALALAITSLDDPDMLVRTAALRSLSVVGGKEQVPQVLQLLTSAADSSERSDVEATLSAICSRHSEETLPSLLLALNGASSESHLALLHVLARVSGPQSLEAVLAALKDPNRQISDEAAALLSNWPTLDAAPHLLELVRAQDPNRKLLGLRGYTRLAELQPSPAERIIMLMSASKLAKRRDEKMIILSAWGKLAAVESLDALRPYLDKTEVQNEAAIAIIQVATDLAKADASKKPQAVSALQTVIAKSKDEDIRERAKKALAVLP